MNDRFEKMRKVHEDFISETGRLMIKFLNRKYSKFQYIDGKLTYTDGPEKIILKYIDK